VGGHEAQEVAEETQQKWKKLQWERSGSIWEEEEVEEDEIEEEDTEGKEVEEEDRIEMEEAEE
jgi:hypothetical protein